MCPKFTPPRILSTPNRFSKKTGVHDDDVCTQEVVNLSDTEEDAEEEEEEEDEERDENVDFDQLEFLSAENWRLEFEQSHLIDQVEELKKANKAYKYELEKSEQIIENLRDFIAQSSPCSTVLIN